MNPSTRHETLFDEGLQLERTHLAWDRTALVFFVDALLLARSSRQLAVPALGIAPAVGFALAGATAWWHGRSSYPRRTAALVAGRSAAHPRMLRLLAAVTALMSIATAAVVLGSLVAT